jgi:Peptidase C13 family/YcxB-like protein
MDDPTLRAQPPRTVFEFESTEAEASAALEFNQARSGQQLRRSTATQALGALAGVAWLGLIYLVALLVIERDRSRLWFVAGLAALSTLLTLSRLGLRRSMLRMIAAGSDSLKGRHTLRIEADGLRFCGPNGETAICWNGIRSIEELSGQFLIYVDEFSFFPIPSSTFVDAAEQAAVLGELRRRAVASASATPVLIRHAVTPMAVEVDSRDERGVEQRLTDTLIDGLRFALFLRPRRRGFSSSQGDWSALVFLVFSSIAIALLGDLLEAGPKGKFSPHGLPGVLFEVPVLLVGAWALARLVGRTRSTLTVFVALMSVALPIDIVMLASNLALKGLTRSWTEWERDVVSRLSFAVATIWFTLAASISAVRLLAAPRGKWLPAALLTGLLISLPMTIDRDRTLWWARHDHDMATDYERRRAIANEDAFYRQPQLLREQLAALKPGRRGVIDLYFVGVAAYADQDVFMKEVHSVAKLFEERFGTRGHSLMLINNPASVTESPIATSTSLGLALKRVAEIMDPDEDILFLFITSHGTRDHRASFEFFPMRLKPVDPGRLKELLDQSGIRRRVVVVSTCYSGAFVDALKDDSTLVITASAGDKSSFGCSSDADFTFFGKAYFDEALRRTDSFSDAFEMAKTAIAERERKANLPGSDPQMFVGKGIQRALEKFVNLRHAAMVKTSARGSRQ